MNLIFLWYHVDMKKEKIGNPVGSLEVPKLLRARKNLELTMSERQKDILVGCVLGDAYVGLAKKPFWQSRDSMIKVLKKFSKHFEINLKLKRLLERIENLSSGRILMKRFINQFLRI